MIEQMNRDLFFQRIYLETERILIFCYCLQRASPGDLCFTFYDEKVLNKYEAPIF